MTVALEYLENAANWLRVKLGKHTVQIVLPILLVLVICMPKMILPSLMDVFAFYPQILLEFIWLGISVYYITLSGASSSMLVNTSINIALLLAVQ